LAKLRRTTVHGENLAPGAEDLLLTNKSFVLRNRMI